VTLIPETPGSGVAGFHLMQSHAHLVVVNEASVVMVTGVQIKTDNTPTRIPPPTAAATTRPL